MKGFLVGATAAALMLATLLVALLPDDPPPPPPEIRATKGARLPMPATINERFAALDTSPTIDRVEASALPVPVSPPPEPTHQRASVRRELCASHGMHRQYYQRNGWTYWRCVR